jgi:hypothetical protein
MQIVVVEDPTQAALLVASFERTDEDATEESGLENGSNSENGEVGLRRP